MKEDEGNAKAWKGDRSLEAVLRELRGKERVRRAKVEARLQLTQEVLPPPYYTEYQGCYTGY